MNDPRAEFNRMFMRNTSLGAAAAHYGLTADEMGLALHYARLSKTISEARKPVTVRPPTAVKFEAPVPEKVWCQQCECNVSRAEAERCHSQFCKVKVDA